MRKPCRPVVRKVSAEVVSFGVGYGVDYKVDLSPFVADLVVYGLDVAVIGSVAFDEDGVFDSGDGFFYGTT